MFLDASIVLAFLLDEAEAPAIQRRIEDERLFASGIVKFEVLLRMARHYGGDFAAAAEDVEAFFDTWRVTMIDIDDAVTQQATRCAARYHHTTGHPARLNMGDCFAYASARTAALKLAYKGEDFVHTDADAIRFGA